MTSLASTLLSVLPGVAAAAGATVGAPAGDGGLAGTFEGLIAGLLGGQPAVDGRPERVPLTLKEGEPDAELPLDPGYVAVASAQALPAFLTPQVTSPAPTTAESQTFPAAPKAAPPLPPRLPPTLATSDRTGPDAPTAAPAPLAAPAPAGTPAGDAAEAPARPTPALPASAAETAQEALKAPPRPVRDRPADGARGVASSDWTAPARGLTDMPPASERARAVAAAPSPVAARTDVRPEPNGRSAAAAVETPAVAAAVAPMEARPAPALPPVRKPVDAPSAARVATPGSETRRDPSSVKPDVNPAVAPVARPVAGIETATDTGLPDLAADEAAATPETALAIEPEAAPATPPPAGEVRGAAAPVLTHVATLQSAGGAPETVARLAADIVRKLEGRTTRFDVALDPVGLGRVDVSVEIDRDGRLTAALSFDSAAAAADLRGRASELRQALEQAGFDLSETSLSFDTAGQGAAHREAREDAREWGARAFQQIQGGVEAADAAIAAAVSTLSRRTDSGVDIRI